MQCETITMKNNVRFQGRIYFAFDRDIFGYIYPKKSRSNAKWHNLRVQGRMHPEMFLSCGRSGGLWWPAGLLLYDVILFSGFLSANA